MISDAIAELYETADEKIDGLKDIVPEIDTSPFDNLRSTFLDTLADMDADTKTFKKNLQNTLVKDLLERFVLDVPINVTLGSIDDPETLVFDNFDEYAKNWNERYMNVINADNLSQEEKEHELDKLIDELVAQEEKLQEASEEIKQRIKERQEDTTFKDMSDGFVSALMDMKTTAEDWAESIGRTMAQKIIEQMVVANSIQPLLDDLQKAFNAAMTAGGAKYETAMNDADIQAQLDIIKQKYPELQALVKSIMDALGVNTEAVKDGFSDLRGSFVSALMDMEGDAETFGKSIGKTMAEQMLDAYIDKTYSEDIKKPNDEWADALESGDPAKIEAIKQKVLDLYATIGDDEAVKKLATDVKELEKQLDTTFSSMADDWVAAMLDIDSTAADFGRQIGQTLVSKLVKELIVTKHLQQYLDAIQKAYNDAIGKEGATVQSVLAAVVPLIDEAVAETEKWKPAVEEIAKKFQELDNSTPLDNIRSSFLSQLMDMQSDTKDFARNINEILTKAFIDKFVLGDEFNKRLEKWKKEYASIMGGNYSEEERADLLKQLRQAITVAKEGYAAEAKKIHEFMGTANYADQQATMNLSDKLTYEQGDMLLGINMAQELTLEQILAVLQGGEISGVRGADIYQQMYDTTHKDETVKQILAVLQNMSGVSSVGVADSYGEQIFNRLGATSNYMKEIRDEIKGHFGNFEMYLANLVKL